MKVVVKKKLVIVESPAKARTLGRILGKGYSFMASQGHIRDLPKSRLGVQVDEDFAELIKNPTTSRKDFQEELVRRQVISLRRAGMRMVAKGETTVEEVLRVA